MHKPDKTTFDEKTHDLSEKNTGENNDFPLPVRAKARLRANTSKLYRAQID